MSVKIFKHEGGLYTLYAKQRVNKKVDILWDFFRKPSNVNKPNSSRFSFQNKIRANLMNSMKEK